MDVTVAFVVNRTTFHRRLHGPGHEIAQTEPLGVFYIIEDALNFIRKILSVDDEPSVQGVISDWYDNVFSGGNNAGFRWGNHGYNIQMTLIHEGKIEY